MLYGHDERMTIGMGGSEKSCPATGHDMQDSYGDTRRIRERYKQKSKDCQITDDLSPELELCSDLTEKRDRMKRRKAAARLQKPQEPDYENQPDIIDLFDKMPSKAETDFQETPLCCDNALPPKRPPDNNECGTFIDSKLSPYEIAQRLIKLIPSIKLGRVYRIPKVYVIQYITEHLSGVPAPAVTPPEAPSMAELANPIASDSVLTAQASGAAQ